VQSAKETYSTLQTVVNLHAYTTVDDGQQCKPTLSCDWSRLSAPMQL